jgi:hypothetical protein
MMNCNWIVRLANDCSSVLINKARLESKDLESKINRIAAIKKMNLTELQAEVKKLGLTLPNQNNRGIA